MLDSVELDKQIQTYNFKADMNEYNIDTCFDYGLWSRYTPLSNINQLGLVGIFDSNCFHLHSALEYSNERLNFIFYDCVDYDTKTIQRNIQFISDDNKLYKYEISIDKQEYEFYWHYFTIIVWPQQKKMELILVQYPVILFQETISISFPFIDVNLILRFGGGLIVNDSKDQVLQLDTKQFSYLPGIMYLHPLGIQDEKFGLKFVYAAIDLFDYSYTSICFCSMNTNINLQDQDMSWLDHNLFASQQKNCDSFVLSTWIKIDKIFFADQDFLYQFIKISANFENTQLTNENLSPFQLFYKISSLQNQLIFTTYSFTFPSVSIDFIKESFLIKKEFDILNEINRWQYLLVYLKENEMSISLTFYQDSQQHNYKADVQVNQFHFIQFKLQYGNILQQTSNYLDIKIRDMKFLNCLDTDMPLRKCHYSCKDCDGPTNNDCLSCSEQSKRIYLPEYRSCICPYDLIDTQECKDYEDLHLQLQSNDDYEQKCQYGYFEVKDTCLKCPSIIKHNLITCLECIENSQTWSLDPYCFTNLYLDDTGSPVQYFEDISKTYYIYDDVDLNTCHSCQSEFMNDIDFIYNFYVSLNQKEVLLFCNQQTTTKCIYCNFINCNQCGISLTGIICLYCKGPGEKIDGLCILTRPGYKKDKICQSPYYVTSQKQCDLCPIDNCVYCFEYYNNDLSKSTLYNDFATFPINEFHKIGCALCNSGYRFDFTTEKCIYQQPSIQNCLRSFINMDSQEVCTLSQVEDFKIAPEIFNCQHHIPNCIQCLLTPLQVLICTLCDPGYQTDSMTGHCKICDIEHAVICMETNLGLENSWNQLIKSFILQFLSDKYYYPFSVSYDTITVALKCKNGFQTFTKSLSACLEYCDSSCLECVENQQQYSFVCGKCQRNYYQQPILVENKGKCQVCPPLCEICKPRSTIEIQTINSNYQITDSNAIYTYQCIKPVSNPNIRINPQLKVAQYCFQENCKYSLLYEILQTSNYDDIDTFIPISPKYFENQVNVEFCNRIGLQKLIIHHKHLIESDTPNLNQIQPDFLQNEFKNNIFTLQQVHLIYQGYDKSANNYLPLVLIQNFDKVEILRMNFIITNEFKLHLLNNNNFIDVKFIDIIITQKEQSGAKLAITSTGFKNFEFQNVSIQNYDVSDSIVFDMKLESKGEDVIINNFSIVNCTIFNSVIFNFANNTRKIIMENLILQSSQFVNSNFINFTLLLQDNVEIRIKNVQINHCNFNNFNFLYSFGSSKFDIQNLSFHYNTFQESTFFIIFSQIMLKDVFLMNNKFTNGSFLIADYQLAQFVYSSIENIIVGQNQLANFSFLILFSNCQTNNAWNLKNFVFFENIKSSIVQQFLFNISCQTSLQVSGLIIKNQISFPYFYLLDIQSILISNVTYTNDIQKEKIPSSLNCFHDNYGQYNPQLIQIYGLVNVEIRYVNISNQFSIDQSLILIQTNIFFQSGKIEKIEISDICFFGNILLKRSLGNFLSQITIYSEKQQEISLRNVIFKENSQNQYIDDPNLSSTTLLYINSQQSNVIITNISCFNNALTNSSSSFIFISAYSIQFNQVYVYGHNKQSYSIWTKYYDLVILSIEYQNKINLVIQQTFPIKTKGGVFSLIATKYTLFDGTFLDIYAESSSVLALKTQGQGQVSLQNVEFVSVQTTFSQIGNTDGCLSIQSQNSLLLLTLTNITFNSVQNVLSSSILTIYPSFNQNYIKLENIKVINCFSLMDQIMKVEFQHTTPKKNQVIIKNLMVEQNEPNFFSYLENLSPLTSLEVKKIANDNTLIQFTSCQISFTSITITGIYSSSLIKISDCPIIFLSNIFLHNIKLLNFFNLLYIGQISSITNTVIIFDIIIQTLDYYQVNNQSIAEQSNFAIKFQKQFCYQDSSWTDQVYTSNTLNVKSFLSDLQAVSLEVGSLFYYNSISHKNLLSISQIQIMNVECKQCLNGLIYFDLTDFLRIFIQEVFCYSNNILNSGCFVVKSQINQSNLLTIKQSEFILNKGQNGVAINAQNLRIVMNKCRFFNNSASNFGGAIYLLQNNEYFLFNQTLISNNKAKEAGGLYLQGNSSLNQSNFINSLLSLNKADLYSNNLQAIPVSLELSINQVQMYSIQNNISEKQLALKPYKMIEQGQIILAKQLKLPSNQKIINYKIYNTVQLKFVDYLTEFSLSLRNIFNEQLPNIINHTCEIHQQDFEQNQPTKLISSLSFNPNTNNFDLGSLSLSIDPYQQKGEINRILIFCQSQYQKLSLSYNFVVQPLKCQLGEFYVDFGCQLCEPNQGFYSVSYNTTKCSIFDPTKFVSITSNLINLKKGYWRPTFESDIIEYCFKNEQHCIGGWLVGNLICNIGYLGGLCEECDKYNIRGQGEYFKQNQQTICQICGEYSQTLAPFILTSTWAILSILLTLKSINNSNKLFQSLKLRQKFAKILFKLNQDHESIQIKLFLNYLWIFSAIFTFNINFAFSFGFINSTSNPSYFMANTLDCYLSQFSKYELIYIRILAMIILLGCQLLLIYIGFKIHAMITKCKLDSSIFSITIVYLYVSNYAALLTQFCSVLAKRTISKIDYIQGDLTLLYGSQSHYLWTFSFILPGLGLIGFFFPFAVFFFLYLKRGELDQIQFRKHLCYLFNEYNDNNYFWEWIKLWKKSIFIFIMIYFESDINLKASLLGLCLLSYQLLAMRNKPFIIESFNALDIQAGQICLISLFLAAVKYISEQKNNSVSAIILQLLIILLCIKLCYPFLSNITKVYIKKYKMTLIILFHKIFNFIKKNSAITLYLGNKINQQKQREQTLRRNFNKLHQYLMTISKNQTDFQKKSLLTLVTSQSQIKF
ncbi:unnamed protein product [Paramecium octaurelia]|uniref:Transmembrane protein n=1 Tax=Paramecium octaurelia TaxID=43137 RepID=A0A8S1SEV1_PAROT|nr:unnamed protein product [Paramecium octaurelia]